MHRFGKIQWSKGKVKVSFSAGTAGGSEAIVGRAAIVTVPLPILQRRHDPVSIHFEPDLPAKRAAALRLEMGQVVKMTFHFAIPVWERADINEELTQDADIDASNISVEVQKGEVTLKGTVPDRETKRRAEDIAESCSGVTEVQNQLRVKRESESETRKEKGRR